MEILTGEGKSIILGIVSALLALFGYRVDVVCYRKNLSERDYKSFKILFSAFGVSDKIFYGTFDELIHRIINNGGDMSELTKHLMSGKPI